MGLNNNDKKRKRFSVKNGKITSWDKTESGNNYSGVVKGMYIRPNEFEGRNTDTLNVLMESDGEQAWIDANIESNAGLGLVRGLVGADLTKEITISALPSKQNDKITFVNVFQSGAMVKWGEYVPDRKVVQVGKKSVVDYTEFREFVEKWLVETNQQLGFKTKGKNSEVAEPMPEDEENIPF